MSTSIIYSSSTGNTKQLAERIQQKLGQSVYCGKPTEEALQSDTLYIGFWAMKFSCSPDIQKVLEGLEGKKIFLFGTAGFGFSEEFYESIIANVKSFIKPSNDIIGSFLCQGKVSEAKKKALYAMDADLFARILPNIELAESHPDAADLAAVEQAI